MKKKILFAAAVLWLALCLGANAREVVVSDFSQGIPAGWNVFEDSARVSAQERQGEAGMQILCEAAQGGISMAAVTTGEMDLTGDSTLSLRMAVGNDQGKSIRTVLLNEELPLLTFSGLTMRVLELGEIVLEEAELFDLDIAYAPEQNQIFVWKDGELAFQGGGDALAGMSLEKATLSFTSYILSEETVSDWFLCKLDVVQGKESTFDTVPEQGAAWVDPESISGIQLDFGVLTTYGTKQGGMVTLECDGQSIPCAIRRSGSRVLIQAEEGFGYQSQYRVLLEGGRDVFGAALGSTTLEFSTAAQGYLAPAAEITEPQDGAVKIWGVPFTVDVEVDEGSEKTERVSLLVNGQVVDTRQQEPYVFSYIHSTGEERILLSALVEDVVGGIVYSPQVEVLFQNNTAPTVSIPGIEPGDEVLTGRPLIVEAFDEDGNLERIEAYLDGQRLQEISSASFQYPDQMAYGEHTLTAVAYDSLGERATAQITAYFTGVEETLLLDQDMSGYENTAGQSVFPDGMMGTDADGFIRSEETDGRNSLILGVPEGRNGKSVYTGISWLGTTRMPKEQFACEMQLYFPDKNSQFISVIRSNEATTRFSQNDIIFRQGTLFLYDGGIERVNVPYEENTWYTLRMEVNLLEGTYSCYLNGQLLANQFELDVKVPDVSVLRFHFTSRWNGETTMSISHFTVWDISVYPYLKSTDVMEEGLPLDQKSVTAFFNRSVGENFEILEASLIGDGDPAYLAEAIYEPENSGVYAELKDLPEAGFEYILTVKGQYMGKQYTTKAAFKAQTASFDADRTEFIREGNRVCFRAHMENAEQEDKEALVLLIKYENGIMTQLQSVRETVTAQGCEISTPAIDVGGENVSIIAVIWDGWEKRIPVNNRIYVFNSLENK